MDKLGFRITETQEQWKILGKSWGSDSENTTMGHDGVGGIQVADLGDGKDALARSYHGGRTSKSIC